MLYGAIYEYDELYDDLWKSFKHKHKVTPPYWKLCNKREHYVLRPKSATHHYEKHSKGKKDKKKEK